MAEKILVISTFPPRGLLYNHPSSAVAGYTKNTLNFANQNRDFSFVILADILDKPERYREDGQEVIRCWQRNSVKLFFSLGKEVFRQKETKKVFLAFEWAMFGAKKWLMVFLPFFLFFLRLAGKEIYFISHGVLLDVGLVSIQMGVKKESFKAKFWSLGLKMLYWFSVNLSHKTVVFEACLRRQLLGLINRPEKIMVIPHGVAEAKQNLNSKKTDGGFLVACFGFLVWYKGSDWLVSEAAEYFAVNPDSKIKLLMVGGATKTYKDDSVYKKYIEEIYATAEKTSQKIEITGFINEDEIGNYFEKADLFVLPYRVLVSASGPLSLVFTYKKPFLISENLEGYCLADDFSQALNQAGLTIKDVVFSMAGNDLINKIEALIKNKEKLEKIEKFSGLMYEKRKWVITGSKYKELLKE